MEYFDICDARGEPTGEIVERGRAHREGIRHRTAHVWILRRRAGRTEILLQKRSRNKDSFPGLYDTSSAGHVPAGDEPLTSALRELREELGIRAEASDLRFIGTIENVYERRFRGELFREDFVKLFLIERVADRDALHAAGPGDGFDGCRGRGFAGDGDRIGEIVSLRRSLRRIVGVGLRDNRAGIHPALPRAGLDRRVVVNGDRSGVDGA